MTPQIHRDIYPLRLLPISKKTHLLAAKGSKASASLEWILMITEHQNEHQYRLLHSSCVVGVVGSVAGVDEVGLVVCSVLPVVDVGAFVGFSVPVGFAVPVGAVVWADPSGRRVVVFCCVFDVVCVSSLGGHTASVPCEGVVCVVVGAVDGLLGSEVGSVEDGLLLWQLHAIKAMTAAQSTTAAIGQKRFNAFI